jgi:lipoate-protein ligase A
MYGQTPEFTHSMSNTFPFGEIVRFPYPQPMALSHLFFLHQQALTIDSRHALITSASLTTPISHPDWWRTAELLVKELKGDRYGSLEKVEELLCRMEGVKGVRLRTLAEWLKRAM